MRLLNFSHYREAEALGNMKGEVMPDSNKDLSNEILSVLQEFDANFRMIFTQALQTTEGSEEFKNGIKKLMGLLKNLKNRPEERQKATRDPLSNTVARAHNGPDGQDGGGGEG